VAGGGKSLGKTLDEKATNTLVAMAKSLAKRRGRPESFAVSIVRDSASYTASEAKDDGAIEILAPDTASLMKQLDGRSIKLRTRTVTLHTHGAVGIEMPLSWAQRFLDVIADPTIASMLLTLGVMGILYEIAAPGIGMGGIVGTVSLLTGLLAMSVLPLDLGGFLLIAVGIIGIVLEIKVPSHGLLALGGVVSIVLGALVLVDESSYFGAVQSVDWRVFAPFVIAVAGLFLLLATKVARAQRKPPGTGSEAMVGKHGVAKTVVEPAGGSVFVEGARWLATAEETIDAGEPVEVVEVLRNPPRVVVKRS
jgi:membrane-bound serine protease (ClpP class)